MTESDRSVCLSVDYIAAQKVMKAFDKFLTRYGYAVERVYDTICLSVVCLLRMYCG